MTNKKSVLTPCKTCDESISPNAKVCPKCGEKNPIPRKALDSVVFKSPLFWGVLAACLALPFLIFNSYMAGQMVGGILPVIFFTLLANLVLSRYKKHTSYHYCLAAIIGYFCSVTMYEIFSHGTETTSFYGYFPGLVLALTVMYLKSLPTKA